MTFIALKKGREASLKRRHPWIFSGALTTLPPSLEPGQTVDIVSHDKQFLARGAVSPRSQIAVRVWTFDPGQPVNEEFFHTCLARAVAKRAALKAFWPTTAVRLVNAESDGLPGLIVDRYGDFLVIQCLSAGVEQWKPAIVECLNRLVVCRGIFERSDASVRGKEGLRPQKGVLRGEHPPDLVEIREADLTFLVDVVNGHKTGFYLDQRENRKILGACAKDADVLNCFAYTGGFGLYALRGGARHVTSVETSGAATALIARHMEINGFNRDRETTLQEDVFEALRRFDKARQGFDLIVLDPPKFAESKAQLAKAARGYKDIALLAFRLINSGGKLFTFSCSGLMDPALFQKITADAALDAGRQAQIISRLGQAEDHPVGLNFPEGAYLKGLVCRVD